MRTAIMTKPIIHAFFNEPTSTVSYLVACPETREAAVIDPVLDYDHKSGTGSAKSADLILQKAGHEDYRITWELTIAGLLAERYVDAESRRFEQQAPANSRSLPDGNLEAFIFFASMSFNAERLRTASEEALPEGQQSRQTHQDLQ
jgi:hypothetical protein